MNRMRFVFRTWEGSVSVVLQERVFSRSEHSLIIGGLLTDGGMETRA